MTNSTTDVAIIMGSDSDLPIVEASFAILDSLVLNTQKT
jgi:phosphoribosylcarboxyaminoimidazole (NCAIR) mutase